LDDLKRIIRLAIDEYVPRIISEKRDIEILTVEKQELQAQIDALNIALEEHDAVVSKYEECLLNLMEAHAIKKMATPKYAVERCRNVNPTITVIDIHNVPKRYICEKPQVDKRTIQSEYVNQKMIPPGVSIEYGQYLNIIDRRSFTADDHKEKAKCLRLEKK